MAAVARQAPSPSYGGQGYQTYHQHHEAFHQQAYHQQHYPPQGQEYLPMQMSPTASHGTASAAVASASPARPTAPPFLPNGCLRHGHGKIVTMGFGTYEGQVRHNKATGNGRFSNLNGDVYEGQWLNDKKHGRGIYRNADGCYYEGQWEDDVKSGEGIETRTDGSTYQGQNWAGKKHGQGIYRSADKTVFEGRFVMDMIDGEGKCTFADGRIYTGQWQQNRMSGEGQMLWPTGQMYKGQYEHGQKSGIGTFSWPDGKSYYGQWVQGRQHGIGTYTDPTGKSWTGHWDSGRRVNQLTPAGLSPMQAEELRRQEAEEEAVERAKTAKLWKSKCDLQLSIEKGELSRDLLKELGGTRHGLPSGVFRLFEKLNLLEGCDLHSGEERNQITWSLKNCSPVFQDDQLQQYFVWLAGSMLVNKELLESYSQLQGSALLMRSAERQAVRRYLCVAWLAQDVLQQWANMAPADRKFFDDASVKLAKSTEWTDLELHEVQGILDRVRGRYIILEKVIKNREPKNVSFFLRQTPLDVLRTTWEDPKVSDQSASKACFFDLYEPLVEMGDRQALSELIEKLVEAYMWGNTDPSDALKQFMATGALLRPQRLKRSFLIHFVTVWNAKENEIRRGDYVRRDRLDSDGKSQDSTPKGGGGPSRWFRWTKRKTTSPSEDEQMSPLSPASKPTDLSITLIELALNDFGVRHPSMTPEDTDALKELFEAALLLTSGDSVHDWAKRLPIVRLELCCMLLEEVVSSHIATILRTAANKTSNLRYNEEEAKRLVADTEKWTHDHFSSPFWPERREHRLLRSIECCQLLRMYAKLDMSIGGSTIWKLIRELEADDADSNDCRAAVFCRICPPGSAIVAAIGQEVQRTLAPRCLPKEEIEKLLSYSGFFDPDIQSFLTNEYAANAVRQNLDGDADFHLLLLAIVKITSLKAVKRKQSPETVMMDVSTMCQANRFTLESTRKVCDEVIARKSKDFLPDGNGSGGFSLASFRECVSRLQLASDIIEFKSKGSHIETKKLIDSVKGVVGSFLQFPLCTWETNLGSLDTIVFFLEYMGKEDLSLAYQKLDADIQSALGDPAKKDDQRRNMLLKQLLDVVKLVYTQPLVELDVNNIAELQNVDIAQVIIGSAKKLRQEVRWCGVTFTPADWDDIISIAGTTAAAMREKFNVLMIPHHTQMITLIMLAIRTCGVGVPKLPKTMLGRVGTGEGKSWIIGMLAAFVVKRGRRLRAGLRAHVVIDNSTLKSRDFDTVSLFFEKLGIRASKKEEHLHNTAYEVVYCTGAEIWAQCRERQELGHSEEFEKTLQKVVLIVDEVDGLIIDGDANIQYMYPDDTLSDYADHWLRLLENGFNPEEPQEGDELLTEELKVALQKVHEAYYEAKEALRGRDFEWRGGFMYMVDKATGMIKVGWWDLWYEIRYWIDTQWEGRVTYKCIKSILCKKHCFTQYSCIFGLTGSLGQKAEQKFLAQHYDAVVFNVPYFLDTCRRGDGSQQCKPVVRSLNRGDIVQPSEEAQIEKVVDLACSKVGEVPVLIIAKDQSKVEEVASRINARLGTSDSDPSHERVLKLLEDPGNPETFVKLVDMATQPLWTDASKKGNKAWRISVTTAEGGRGHDYRVVDPAVDEKGGLLLILMWVSWSQREWVQFLGRTARQDHQGQVAVYLNGQSREVSDIPDAVDLRNPDQVVQTILAAGDAKMKVKCDKVGTHISRGTLMHRLTARYWRQQMQVGSTTQKQENVWRRLCRHYLADSCNEEILKQEFAAAFPPDEYLGVGAPPDSRCTGLTLGTNARGGRLVML
eukprot:TRINITY_DN3161_c0_g3_i1.p1 TRINITY_DN3161_c0_g3~~TRINITY_DN3161_c0_g3_i1.p1  ORF type:complete len:1788 (+),score=434.49 TRINITY_DN3161_c0_g3_i1:61-5424(+)